MTPAIDIVESGISTTLQDLGRPGYAHLGVPAAGAVDPALAGIVNRLVGNRPDATLIETCGGLTVRARAHALVASSAEPAPRSLSPGETYSIAPGGSGRLWHYLAIRGGLEVESVLGSMSTDTLSRLGPPPCQNGSTYEVGIQPDEPIVADVAPLTTLADRILITPGPRADWFDSDWADRLTDGDWTVTASSRVGVRLAGAALTRTTGAELPSEGLVRGAIQVPPDGDLVMMLSDHPTTGGYPVIAVVIPGDIAVLAQHAPGTTIRFRFEPAV